MYRFLSHVYLAHMARRKQKTCRRKPHRPDLKTAHRAHAYVFIYLICLDLLHVCARAKGWILSRVTSDTGTKVSMNRSTSVMGLVLASKSEYQANFKSTGEQAFIFSFDKNVHFYYSGQA